MFLPSSSSFSSSFSSSSPTIAGVLHPYFVMFIDREKILQSALQQIMTASDNDLLKPLRVVFVNEEAIDEGGVRKEFFQLLVAQLFSLEFGKNYSSIKYNFFNMYLYVSICIFKFLYVFAINFLYVK